jgi:hypothetical protein
MINNEVITALANDDFAHILTTPELKQRFIDQVYNYADGCCETEQELYCFIDGLLMNLYS